MIERRKFDRSEIVRANFLVFDPESALRSLLRSILLSMGVREITTAATVEKLREIPRDKVDILLLRLTPDRLGEGLVRSVRRGTILIRKSVPVIVYASEPTVDLVKAILSAGADEVIALPFTGRAVMGKVTAALVNPRPMTEINGIPAPDHTDSMKALESFVLSIY